MPAQNRITKPPARKRVAFFVAYFVSTKPRLVGWVRSGSGYQACRTDFTERPAYLHPPFQGGSSLSEGRFGAVALSSLTLDSPRGRVKVNAYESSTSKLDTLFSPLPAD
jgi:hypothetical protein